MCLYVTYFINISITRVLVKVPVAAKIKVTAEHSVRVLWSRPGEEGHRVPEDAVGQGLLVHDAGRLLQL